MTTRPVTTWDVLDGHVTLDLQCLDRIYLNGYVPNLQVGGQIVQFLAGQGFPIPSPAVVARIGDRFRDAGRLACRHGAHPGGAVRQARPQARRDAAALGSAGCDRSVGDRRYWCGAGVSVGRLQQHPAGPRCGCAAFRVGSGGAAGVVFLLLSVG